MKNTQSQSKTGHSQGHLTTSEIERIIVGSRRNRSRYIHNLIKSRLLQPLDNLGISKALTGYALQQPFHRDSESEQGI